MGGNVSNVCSPPLLNELTAGVCFSEGPDWLTSVGEGGKTPRQSSLVITKKKEKRKQCVNALRQQLGDQHVPFSMVPAVSTP